MEDAALESEDKVLKKECPNVPEEEKTVEAQRAMRKKLIHVRAIAGA